MEVSPRNQMLLPRVQLKADRKILNHYPKIFVLILSVLHNISERAAHVAIKKLVILGWCLHL